MAGVSAMPKNLQKKRDHSNDWHIDGIGTEKAKLKGALP